MKYISIDTETFGVDPVADTLLEIGAVMEDTSKLLSFENVPKFKCIIDVKSVSGSVIAADMNKRIIEILAKYQKMHGEEKANYRKKHNILRLDEVTISFYKWVCEFYVDKTDKNYKNSNFISPIVINAAGKNFSSFDRLFLNGVPFWKDYIKPHRRTIDPAVLFLDFKNDDVVPDLSTCKQRAGLEPLVTHNALEDAWDVVQVLRKKY